MGRGVVVFALEGFSVNRKRGKNLRRNHEVEKIPLEETPERKNSLEHQNSHEDTQKKSLVKLKSYLLLFDQFYQFLPSSLFFKSPIILLATGGKNYRFASGNSGNYWVNYWRYNLLDLSLMW